MPLRVATVSLGCNKNLVDTEVMLGLLKDAGYEFTRDEKQADILLVNTCGFITEASQESVNTILEVSRYKKKGNCKALIVTGCLVQRYKNDLMKEIPEIDGILGTGDFTGIVKTIESALKGERKTWEASTPSYIYNEYTPRILTGNPFFAYLKIADGCNNRCSYCTIPSLRGRLRSRKIESVLKEVERLTEQGVKEINMVAQDVTSYGLDLYGQSMLSELLRQAARIPKVEWIRILYAYPTMITDELIESIAQVDKVCNYLDLPLQHINNDILRSMNRRGTKAQIYALIEKLRKEIPELVLRTSLIVGYPGETEEQYHELIEFVKDIEFERLGVFKYSQEEDTPAGELANQIAPEVKEERYEKLMSIQRKISLRKNKNLEGKTLDVLIERYDEETGLVPVGRSRREAPEIDGNIYVSGKDVTPGKIVRVRITNAYEYDLVGETTEE